MTVPASDRDAISAPEEVEVDGLVNVRDLGGLRRAGGGETPRGVLFRSEKVDAVTERGWEQLRALGVGRWSTCAKSESGRETAAGAPAG